MAMMLPTLPPAVIEARRRPLWRGREFCNSPPALTAAAIMSSVAPALSGVGYEDHEVVSKLHAVAKAPIFAFGDSQFGQGIVGGPGASTQDLSRDFASVALRILCGEALGGLKIPGTVVRPPKFDWREMQHWGISESRLPPGSTIYYRDPTAWERYHWQIAMIAGALLVQTLLIVGLFYKRHRRRNAEAASRQHLSELAHMNRSVTAGELSTSIAHEMMQPLAAILTNGNAGLRWLAKATPNLDQVRASLESVIAAAHHAGNAIRTIRSMFKKSNDEKDCTQSKPVDPGSSRAPAHQSSTTKDFGRDSSECRPAGNHRKPCATAASHLKFARQRC
jgi:hypothetical protein